MMRYVYSLFVFFLAFLVLSASSSLAVGSKTHSITLFNEDAAQFEMVCSNGQRILFDVIDSSLLSREVTSEDILLVSHAHPDHYDKEFVSAFPGKKIVIEEGEIQLNDITITSIASAHTAMQEDAPKKKDGSNYILLIEVEGMKIAHLGDIGQDRLTAGQLSLLGEVDIAISQFINPLSQMDMQNKKGFYLMSQISPKLIIPTSHGRFNNEMVRYAKTILQVRVSENEKISFAKETLPTEPTLLVWGDGASFLKDDFALQEW